MGNSNSSNPGMANIGHIMQQAQQNQPLNTITSLHSIAPKAQGALNVGQIDPVLIAQLGTAQKEASNKAEAVALELQSKDDFTAIFYSQARFQGNQTVVKAGQINIPVGTPLSYTLGKNVNISLKSSPTQKDKDGNPAAANSAMVNDPQWLNKNKNIKYAYDASNLPAFFSNNFPMFADVILHQPNPSCACSYAPVVSSFENFENTSQEYYFYIIIIITVLLIAYVNREKIIKLISKKD